MNNYLYSYFIEIIEDLSREIYARTYFTPAETWNNIIVLLDDIIESIKQMEQKNESE